MTTAAELRELPDDELRQALAEHKEELFNLRFQIVTGQLDDPRRIKQVKREIARVLTVLREREIAASRENERLRALVGFRDITTTDMVPARVVSKDITRQDNTLTLNVGRNDGVAAGMPVLDERGLIGKVVYSSANYSLVMPHQNTNFAVPAQITELNRDGIVRWDGQQFDRLLMEYVVKTEPVEPGMLVSTSLVSGNYPPGVPIGRIDSVFAARGRNDLVIYIQPSAPLAAVDLVYVILSPVDEELEELQAVQFGPRARR